MFSAFFSEFRSQLLTLRQIIKTREFWIYFAVIVVLLLIAAAGIRLATGFDPMTRGMLRMSFSCNTSEGRLATIMVGSLVFGIASVLSLGEVVYWVETTREMRVPGRVQHKISYWRPILHVLGTAALGTTGYLLMLSWCS